MLQRVKLTVTQLLADPNSRTILILSIVLVAILAGGAPNDGGF